MTSSAPAASTTITHALRQAEADAVSVTALAQELVRIPSCGGIDDPEPVLAVIETWFNQHGLPHRRLYADDKTPAAIVIEISGAHPGPAWVLDACLDTAPIDDEATWSFPPIAGDIVDNQLRGRGAADSKIAAAMFCHLAVAISRQSRDLAGTLVVLLDVDEHTGNFSGAKALLHAIDPSTIGGAMIGYPGADEVIIGGRGVYRALLHVYGLAGHSGSSKPAAANAATRAARLAARLEDLPLPSPAAGGFPLPAKLTVTEIHSGAGFTVVPDHAVVSIDVRLTDTLDDTAAHELISTAVAQLDTDYPGPRPTEIECVQSWPPYRLSAEDQPAAALIQAAATVGFSPRPKVAGPSNIGNLLALHSIATTAGFGLPYTGLHGTDEQVDLTTLPAVQAAYHLATLTLMHPER
ncbi:M20 family metallopeptidase [Nocardia alni]|uniref:M20 family metallopeptidase n=1 Tax=Nocardia alni TaxID=2815723 RepID=UPI001C23A8E0|nr:M20/M25/M40 family metallo-hydrolase [Nocardia alni]